MRIVLALLIVFALFVTVEDLLDEPIFLCIPVLGVICWVLAARISRQERTIARLESALLHLRERVENTQPAAQKATAADADKEIIPDDQNAAHDMPAPVAPYGRSSDFAYSTEHAESDAPVLPSQPLQRPALSRSAPEPGAAAAALTAVRDWFTGGNPVVKVGLIVLFFGVSFLLKYASDHSLLPVELRMAGAGLLGVVLLGIGWRLRLRQTVYALLVQGGGVGVLYLTVFAATRYFDMLPPVAALALMTLIVLFSGILAVVQNASGLAIFGTAGGFLAPILLSSGQGSHIQLFAYYALLNAGVLGVAWFRTWRVLNLLGFAFTFGIGAAWGALEYVPEHFMTTEPFLILFFLMYAVISMLFARNAASTMQIRLDSALVFGLPLATFGLQMGLVQDMEFGGAISSLALGAWYLLSLLYLRRTAGLQLLSEAHFILGVIFGSLAIPMALDATWTSSTWALEGAAMIWLGLRQTRVITRILGVCLQLGAAAALLSTVSGSFNGLDFGQLMGGIFLAVGGLASGLACWCWKERLVRREQHADIVFGVWGVFWWYTIWLSWISTSYPDMYGACSLLLATATLGGWWILNRRLSWPVAAYAAVLTLPLMLLLATAWPLHPATHLGWAAWPLTLGCWFAAVRTLEGKWHTQVAICVHAGSLVLVAMLLTRLLVWLTDQATVLPTWTWMAAGMVSILLTGGVCWLSYPEWPLVRHRRAYVYGGTVLGVWIAVWWAGACLHDGNPAPLPYVPLISPLDLAQLMSILVMTALVRRLRDMHPQMPPMTLLVPAVMAFVLLNILVARSVHAFVLVPYVVRNMLDSAVFQTACSVLWTLAAFAGMLAARSMKQRQVWFGGAGLLGVVVLKLFIIDLSGHGTVTRIVSFLAVGVLMLVVGYFCPVPPRKEMS